MISVSKHVRDTVVGLLSDGTVGFNATLPEIADAYSVPSFSIDFSNTSKTFFQGWYSAKDILETTTAKLPIMSLYTIKSQNQNTSKYVTFAGAVMLGLDVYLSLPKTQAKPNTDDLSDAVESTFYTVFNSVVSQPLYGDVLYNGDLLIKRGPVAQGAQNWLQLINATVSFDLIVA